MIAGQRVLAVIPARGGSKGIPGKNLRTAAGRPLIVWTIEAARGAPSIDLAIVSTDDDSIATVASAAGCLVPFKRPKDLASDTATTTDVVIHALDHFPDYQVVMVLQPTSPLRSADQIEAAVGLFAESGAPACVSVRAVDDSPYWMYRMHADGRLDPVIDSPALICRRQDLPAVYSLNGAIYIAKTDWFRRTRSFLSRETIGFPMPTHSSLDIDTQSDFDEFQRIVSENGIE